MYYDSIRVYLNSDSEYTVIGTNYSEDGFPIETKEVIACSKVGLATPYDLEGNPAIWES
jgi:hypothetical protein